MQCEIQAHSIFIVRVNDITLMSTNVVTRTTLQQHRVGTHALQANALHINEELDDDNIYHYVIDISLSLFSTTFNNFFSFFSVVRCNCLVTADEEFDRHVVQKISKEDTSA